MKRILLIEDDNFYAKTMKKAIQRRFMEMEVEVAATMAEAKKRLDTNNPDLIVADLYLPDSDGDHIPKLVEEGYSVIVVTGDSDLSRKEEISRLDIIDYIIKFESSRFGYLLKLIARLEQNKGKTILVAEDASTVRELFKRFLARQNLRVLCAADGEEALRILGDETVDIVLSDYNMPKVDGLDLLKAVRERYSMFELPFIAVSSDEGGDTVGTFLKLGANDYLKKPFNKEELLCRINNTLDTVEMFEEMMSNAITDPLTGLYNRRYLSETGPKLVAASGRYKEHALSVVIFDIDHFKHINDTYGHLAGDKVLKEVARALQRNVRASDICVRFGGEEFLVLLPSTDFKRAFIVAEKIRKIVANMAIPVEEGENVHLTISGGVAAYAEGLTLESLIKRADEALYRAKQAGRDRIEMHEGV